MTAGPQGDIVLAATRQRGTASALLPGLLLIGWLLLCAPTNTRADSWQITPSGTQMPAQGALSVAEFHANIKIESGHAIVSIREVFRNKTGNVLEGSFGTALPGDAAISDFAVWDDVVRIPGVILERKRAGELYDQIRAMQIDPGLLQSGEVSESNAEGQARRSTEFSAKIVPIPAQGYKRVELAYRQTVPVDQLASAFVLPLKPGANRTLTIENFSLTLDLKSLQALSGFQVVGKSFLLKFGKQDAHSIQATFEANNFVAREDFAVRYKLAADPKPQIDAFRDPHSGEPGFFGVSVILSSGEQAAQKAPRTVLVLFDTSLSMQWDKLERCFQALEGTLRSLTPADRFNVFVFNSDVKTTTPGPVAATPAAVAKALDFVRASTLRGGTNLEKALKLALEQAVAPNTDVVLLSDGEMTEGVVVPNKLATWFDGAWSAKPVEIRPHIYTLAIGDDANLRLMTRLATHSGASEQVRSTEPLEFKLAALIGKIGLKPFDSVAMNATPAANFDLVYRLEASNYPASRASWVGEYKQPGQAIFSLNATYGGRPLPAQSTAVKLPVDETDHVYLPATWARARVDALLEKIDRDGEDAASIAEIIRLSRKYKFVTPYTSFLAAPRSLLRPRLIRPGDPVLRVRTDASVISVIALFPFSLSKPLRHLKEEDIWQTRFLAPNDMPDGVHTVRLILRDRDGHVVREEKTFVISSQPPVVRTTLSKNSVRAGDSITLNVRASQTTRRITARLYGAEPVTIQWAEDAKSNTGNLVVPVSLPAGRYSIHVTAEDIAHNVSHQEVPLDVLP
jgi:Ca-activated chloride channel homolog